MVLYAERSDAFPMKKLKAMTKLTAATRGLGNYKQLAGIVVKDPLETLLV